MTDLDAASSGAHRPEGWKVGWVAEFLKTPSGSYEDHIALRLLVQSIPVAGLAFDAVLAAYPAQLREQRLRLLFAHIFRRLKRLERVPEVAPGEELFDFIVAVMEKVVRTRSEEKIKRFAAIVANQVERLAPWDEAETAARLLGGLTDRHVEILSLVLAAGRGSGVFSTVNVAALTGEKRAASDVNTVITATMLARDTGIRPAMIRLICAELLGLGLLHDEGVGRVSTPAMEYFVATDLAKWFVEWLADKESNAGDSTPANLP